MKRKIESTIIVSAASLLAFAALAQDPVPPKADRPGYTHDPLTQPRADRLNSAAKTSDLIGMTVKNYQDEKLGKVEDLAVDVQSGRLVEVILSTGGLLGNTLTAVPPGALHHDVAKKVLHLDADKAKLTAAPKFDNSKWEEATQVAPVTKVYTYYGEQPYFVVNAQQSATTSEDLKIVKSLPRHMDGTINTDASSAVEKARNVEAVRKVAQTHNMRSTRNADGTWTREYYPMGSGTNSSWASLGQVQKASKLNGMAVKNRQDEKLGDVENVLVDLPAGRIVAVVISSGGFLGMGDELSAVPPTALRFTSNREALQLDATKETLSQAPHFKANQWPDFSQPSYAGGMYRAYNVDPYFTSDGSAAADNSQRNVRDRDDGSITPLDQGDSKADIAMTAQIRKEIVAGKNMSVNAQNVKIITRNGRVTLRGPVNNTAEKSRIGEIANRIASPGNVDNQLDVQINTSSNN